MANRYLVAGGTGQWNSTTNWSATSGGAAGASVPVAADTVTLDSASGSAGINVNVASACTSIVATTGYTGTLTMSSTLTVGSTVTFVSGMTYAGGGTLILAGTGSYTSGGISISGFVQFNPTVTHTLLDTWNVSTTTVSTSTGTVTINSAAGITLNTNSLDLSTLTAGIFTGTAKIVLVGSGFVTASASWSGGVTNSIDINSVSTAFINNFRYSGGTLKYIAGVVSSSALVLRGAATLDTAGMSWSSILLVAGTYTIALNSNLNITGSLTVPQTTSSVSFSGSFVVNTSETIFPVSSNTITLNGGTINTKSLTSTTLTSGSVTGTTKFVLVGTGTVSFPAGMSGSINSSIDINSTSTVFTGNFRYSTGTITYVAGTIDVTNSTLVLTSSVTLNTAGMYWGIIILPSNTITLGSNLNCNTLRSTSATITFSGAFVVNTNDLNLTATSGGTTFNGGTINAASFTSTTLTSGSVGGTTKIVLVGTGTVSFPAGMTGSITINIDINSTSTTFTGNFRYSTGTITYIAGAIDVTNSTLVLTAGATLNTAGMDWGNVTINALLTLTLTSAFTCSGTFTIPSSNLTVVGTGFWTRVGNLTFTGTTNTLALLNNLTVTGTLTTSTATTINGNSLLIANLNSVGTITGTTAIVFNSTGTWSGTGTLTNNTSINTAGTLTISGNVNYRTGTLTYTAGTVDSSAGTLVCTAASTLNTGGMTWTNITLTGTQTLSSNLNVSGITRITGTTTFVNTGRFTQTGTLDINGNCAFTLINNITVLNTFSSTNPAGNSQTMTGFQIICNGGIYTSGTGGWISGTTTILLNGTGTWTSAGVSDQNAIRNNVTINTAGTITFVDYSYFNTGTLTYTAGTVVTTGSTLRCFANTTLNTNGISWNNIAFAGTITLLSNLTVAGTTLFGAAVSTFVNTGRFTQTGNLTLIGAATVTLINNITVLGNLSFTDTGAQTLNGFQLTVNGGIYTSGTDYVSGSTTILLNGTGTWTSDLSNGTIDVNVNYITTKAVRNNTTINTAGTITFSGVASFNTGTLTYTAGTIVTTDSTLNCYGATTLNTSGINWNNIQINGVITLPSTLTVTGTTYTRSSTSFTPAGRFTQTGNLQLYSGTILTLPNNITVTGNLSTLGSSSNHIVNSFQISVGGGLVLSETAGATLGGTSTIVLTGTGTWSGAATVLNNLSINTAGTITVSGPVYYSTGTLTYVAGTVNTTGSTLTIKGSSTLNTLGMQWGALDIDTAATITLPSQLYTNDNIYLDSTGISFADAGGFSCYGILQRVFGTITLASGVTFAVRNSFESISSSNTSRSLFKSSVPGSSAILTLEPSATQSIGYVDATDIDSSLGQKLWTFKGALNNATNWQELTALSTGTGTGTVSAGSSYTWVS